MESRIPSWNRYKLRGVRDQMGKANVAASENLCVKASHTPVSAFSIVMIPSWNATLGPAQNQLLVSSFAQLPRHSKLTAAQIISPLPKHSLVMWSFPSATRCYLYLTCGCVEMCPLVWYSSERTQDVAFTCLCTPGLVQCLIPSMFL